MDIIVYRSKCRKKNEYATPVIHSIQARNADTSNENVFIRK